MWLLKYVNLSLNLCIAESIITAADNKYFEVDFKK